MCHSCGVLNWRIAKKISATIRIVCRKFLVEEIVNVFIRWHGDHTVILSPTEKIENARNCTYLGQRPRSRITPGDFLLWYTQWRKLFIKEADRCTESFGNCCARLSNVKDIFTFQLIPASWQICHKIGWNILGQMKLGTHQHVSVIYDHQGSEYGTSTAIIQSFGPTICAICHERSRYGMTTGANKKGREKCAC